MGTKGARGTLGSAGLAVTRPGLVPLALHPVQLSKGTYTIEVQAEAGTSVGFEPTVLALTQKQPLYEPEDRYWSFDTWDVGVEEPGDDDGEFDPPSAGDEPHRSLLYRVTLDSDTAQQSAGAFVVAVSCSRCGERGSGPALGGAYRVRITKGEANKPWPATKSIGGRPRGQAAMGAAAAVDKKGITGKLTASELRQGHRGLSAYRAHSIELKPETNYTIEVRRTAGADEFSPTVELVESVAAESVHGEPVEPEAKAGLAGYFRRFNYTTTDEGKLSILVSCEPCGKLENVFGEYQLTIVEGTHRLIGEGLLPEPLGSERPLSEPQEVGELMHRDAPDIKPTPRARRDFVASLNELCPDVWCEGEFNYDFKTLVCDAGASCTLRFDAKHYETDQEKSGSLPLPALSLRCTGTSDRTFCTGLGPTEAFSEPFSSALQKWERAQR